MIGYKISVLAFVILFLISGVLLPIGLIKNIIWPEEITNHEVYSSLLEDMKSVSRYDRSAYLVFIIHRLVFALILTLVNNLQLHLIMFMQVLNACWITYHMSFKTNSKLQIFNELTILLSIQSLFLFTDFVD